MKSVPFHIFALLSVLVLVNTAYADEPLTLKQVSAMVQHNPALLARTASAEAYAFKPAQVGGLPDPVLSIGAISFPVDTLNRDQENMTQLQVGISQSFPFPGTLGLAAQSDEYMAQAASLDVDELRLQLISHAQQSWWSLFYLDRALDTVARNKQLLKQLIRIAESKYKTGQGLQQDVLLAQLELSKLLDIQLQLQSARQQESIRLNTVLNRPAQQSIVLPQAVEETWVAAQAEQVLMDKALQYRPKLNKQNKLIEAAEAQVSLADKAYYPDFKLGATYGFRAANPVTNVDRADLASITLSMSLPFFGETQDANADEKKAALASQGFAYQDAKQAVMAEISQALTSYEQSKAQVALFKQGIIPQAKQTVASMRAAYQVNKVDFLNLIRAQITLYNYETQYWKAFASAKQALAMLGAAVGEEGNDE